MISEIDDLLKILSLLNKFELFSVVLFLILVYVFIFPEKAEKIGAWINRLFAVISSHAARRYIALDIQSKINEEIKKINKELKDCVPYGIKIKWVDSENVRTELKDGNIIIFMRNYKSQSKNLVHTSLAYVCEALLPYSRTYIDKSLMKAIDHTIVRKIIRDDTSSIRYHNVLVDKESENDKEFRDWLVKTLAIDEQGGLVNIVLFDFMRLRELYPRLPNEEIYRETKAFVDLVYQLAIKRPEEDVELIYEGNILNVALVPVAKSGKQILGPEPYVNWVDKLLQDGIEQYHLIAAGRVNVAFAELVAENILKKLPLELARKSKYKGRFRGKKMTLICITLRHRDKHTRI